MSQDEVPNSHGPSEPEATPAVETPSAIDVSPKADSARRARSRLTRTLPTDRISFAKQLDIITALPVAYVKNGNSSFTLKDVADLIGMSESTVVQISAFLSDVSLVQRGEGGKFVIGSELLDFERVRGFSPEKAWLKLAPLFDRSWFGQELLPRLKLRELPEEDAIEALAEACSADKSHKDQLRLAITYLDKTGLIQREGNLLRLANGSQEPEKAEEAVPPPPIEPTRPEDIEIEGLEKHSLTLSPKSGRKVIIFAPPTLKQKELERLQQWLGFQFIIEEEDSPS